MAEDELILFAGDALGYLSAGRVRAAMHEVRTEGGSCGGGGGGGGGGAPRLSMPLFLRPRLGAILDPATASPGAPRVEELPPLPVSALEANRDDVRSRWWWKQDPYYDGAIWLPDESGPT